MGICILISVIGGFEVGGLRFIFGCIFGDIFIFRDIWDKNFI